MKINDYVFLEAMKKDRAQTKDSPGAGACDFGGVFCEQEQKERNAYLVDLRLKIEQQGEKLARTVNINDLKYYKKMITDFLQHAIGETLSFKKESLSSRSGRRYTYSLVHKVNQRVEDLVKQVMEEEKNHIEILRTIDDIRGMLVDLTT